MVVETCGTLPDLGCHSTVEMVIERQGRYPWGMALEARPLKTSLNEGKMNALAPWGHHLIAIVPGLTALKTAEASLVCLCELALQSTVN